MGQKNINARILARRDTTANWNAASGFVPMDGEIIVYTDHRTRVVDGETVKIPGIKIGTGNAYVQDLAFVADDVAEDLTAHIGDSSVHVTPAEKVFWDNKLNVDMNIIDETLEFTRN